MPKELNGVSSPRWKKHYEKQKAKKQREAEEEARRLEEEELALIRELEETLLKGEDKDIARLTAEGERLSQLREVSSQSSQSNLSSQTLLEDLPPLVRAKFITQEDKLAIGSDKAKLFNSLQSENSNTLAEKSTTLPDWEAEDEEEIRAELKKIMQRKGKGNKRNPAQVLMDRAEVAQLLRRGWSKAQIADKMGVTISQVSYDWKVTIREIQESRDSNSLEKINELLEQYAEVKREAWEAWERSKMECLRESVEEEQVRQIEEVSEDEDEDNCNDASNYLGDDDVEDSRIGKLKAKIKKAKTQLAQSKQSRSSSDMTVRRRVVKKGKEGRNPANEYLKTILACLEAERELQALNPSKEIDLKGQIDWDILASGIPDQMEDEVEKRIVEALGYNPSDENSSPYQNRSAPTPKEQMIMRRSEDIANETKIQILATSKKTNKAKILKSDEEDYLEPDEIDTNPDDDECYPTK